MCGRQEWSEETSHNGPLAPHCVPSRGPRLEVVYLQLKVMVQDWGRDHRRMDGAAPVPARTPNTYCVHGMYERRVPGTVLHNNVSRCVIALTTLLGGPVRRMQHGLSCSRAKGCGMNQIESHGPVDKGADWRATWIQARVSGPSQGQVSQERWARWCLDASCSPCQASLNDQFPGRRNATQTNVTLRYVNYRTP